MSRGSVVSSVLLVYLTSAILSRSLTDEFLESRIESGIGIEPHGECDIQYGVAVTVDSCEQLLGMLNSKAIQVIKKTHTESGIDDL